MARSYTFRRVNGGIEVVMAEPEVAVMTKNGTIVVQGWRDGRNTKIVVFKVANPQAVKRVFALARTESLPEGENVEFHATEL